MKKKQIEPHCTVMPLYKTIITAQITLSILLAGLPQAKGSVITESATENSVIASEQQERVSGKITDQEGVPIPGATVMVKGTTTGIVSDIDGNYSLEVEGSGTLVFSFIGMRSVEVQIDGRSHIDISMGYDVVGLDEVVAVGYGTMDKKELTTSVTHISSSDFLSNATTSPLMQIQGKVAGVSIQNTSPSDPNASESIQIRGAGSRSAGNSPLIVIDGIPGGDLKNVDDNDIKSIDILKGGAAAAIYGTRATNGVIIITTKKGTVTGRTLVEYNGYMSTDFVKNKLELLSVDEFLELGISRDEGARTDWFDELIRSFPLSHSHSIALSSGDSKTTYRASVQYRNFEGIDIASGREEYGARINITHSALDKLLEFDLNLVPRFVSEKHTDTGAFSQAIKLNPTLPVMDPENPSEYNYIVAHDTWNPVERLSIEEKGAKRKYFTGSGTVKLNITSNLNTSLMYAVKSNDKDGYFFSPSTSTRSKNSSRRGEAERRYETWDDKILDFLINYIYDRNNITLKAMGGYSYQYHLYSDLKAKNFDFPSDALTYNDLGQGSYLKEGRAEMSSDKKSHKTIGFFGRAAASYLGKYFLTGSLRREGSSKFGENNKWGWFPGLSVGWRVSDESFMSSQSLFDDLKLRADYGVTGNSGFNPYTAQKLYSGAGQYYMNGGWIKGFGPGNNYNPDLAWERAINFNIGVDFLMLDNWLGGSIDLYERTSKGLLGEYDVAVPPNIHEKTWVNVGTIKNRGIELSINALAAKTDDFEYMIDGVVAYNKNWLVSFSDDIYESGQVFLGHLPVPGSPGPVYLLEEGGEISSFYMLKHAGIDEEGMFLIYTKDENGNFTDNKIRIEGSNEQHKYHAGSGVPKVTASLSNTFKYKNFDMGLYFRGAFGHKILNQKNMYYGLKALEGSNLLRKAYFPGDGIQLHEVSDAKKVTDYFLQSGNWVKLDVINLGYTFNTPDVINSLRVYLSGRNMFTFTKYDGIDPELAKVNGLEAGQEERKYYPVTRTITLGVQVSF